MDLFGPPGAGRFDNEASKWSGGVLGPDGWIFGMPSNTDTVLMINSLDRNIDYIYIDEVEGKWKWSGGVLGPDKKTIFATPFNAEAVLAIDTEDLTTEMFGEFPVDEFGEYKWVGGVLAPDNVHIYCLPYNAETVLVINTLERTCETFGYFPGKHKWKGGVLSCDGRCIYGLPVAQGQVLEINLTDRSTRTFGNLKGEWKWPGFKWSGGVLSPTTGEIFGIPLNSASVLTIGPPPQVAPADAKINQAVRDFAEDVFRTGKLQVALDGRQFAPPFAFSGEGQPRPLVLFEAPKTRQTPAMLHTRTLSLAGMQIASHSDLRKGDRRKAQTDLKLPSAKAVSWLGSVQSQQRLASRTRTVAQEGPPARKWAGPTVLEAQPFGSRRQETAVEAVGIPDEPMMSF